MKISMEFKSYVNSKWGNQFEALGARQQEVLSAIGGGTEEAALLLKYLYISMPLSDAGDYPVELFRETVCHGLFLREAVPWCAELPEHLFLLYVLPPRINTEELRSCRHFFYESLWPRVCGKSLQEAVLEVNRWCAEQATYRSTDDRTAAPLSVYQCGYGRCGEESAFLAAALRSVGIAARQVYAPWWSHCDDNHAWVEAYHGTRWRFLGACEPEPVLDLGWFVHAASRAMTEQVRAFVPGTKEELAFLFPDSSPEDLLVGEGMVTELVTSRYAVTEQHCVRVLGEDGKPAASARVCFEVLNMAGFHPVAVAEADAAGEVRLRLGLGSVLIVAAANGLLGEKLVNTAEERETVLVLSEKPPLSGWTEFDFIAPEDHPLSVVSLTAEQKLLRTQTLCRCAALRSGRARQGAEAATEEEALFLSLLTEKDRAAPLPEDVWKDAQTAFQWREKFLPEVFERALLSSRISREPLRPWRQLRTVVPEELRKAFAENPANLWEWMNREIREEKETYQAIPATPAGMAALKAASPENRKALFVAFCRSLGVPARLAGEREEPEYFQDGSFRRLFSKEAVGRLTVQAPAGHAGLYRQNWSLSELTEQGFHLLSASDIPAGEEETFVLPQGVYRILTVSRTPGGNQLAKQCTIAVKQGEETLLPLSFRQVQIADLLEQYELPDCPWHPVGKREAEDSAAAVLENGKAISVWLETSREPTEHILNELREAADSVCRAGLQVHLVVESEKDLEDPTLRRTRAVLPEAKIWCGDFQTDVPALARRTYVDPERLPLVLLTDGRSIRYACCGYNVGTIELLLRMSEMLQE